PHSRHRHPLVSWYGPQGRVVFSSRRRHTSSKRDWSSDVCSSDLQIRGLEQQFGTRLFVRGARSVRLTADGERYLAKVSAALAMRSEERRVGKEGSASGSPADQKAKDEPAAGTGHAAAENGGRRAV